MRGALVGVTSWIITPAIVVTATARGRCCTLQNPDRRDSSTSTFIVASDATIRTRFACAPSCSHMTSSQQCDMLANAVSMVNLSRLGSRFMLMAVSVFALAAQAPVPSFDVTSVRENTSGSSASDIASTSNRFVVTNTPLGFIILHAYQLMGHQLVDVPEWAWSAAYDIAATYPGGVRPSDGDTRAMLQRLLAERFRLTIRREKRDLPVYRLVMVRADGRLGPQLTPSNVDCEKLIAEKGSASSTDRRSPVAPGGRRPECTMSASRRGLLTGGTQPISALAGALQAFLGRPVVDATGLQGRFDMDLEWTPNAEISAPPSGVAPLFPDGPSLLTAVQEQLGLKLENGTASFDVVVVQRVERPTPD